jgi:hypothetical protein
MKKKPAAKRRTQANLRINPALVAWIDKHAEATGISRNTFIEKWIEVLKRAEDRVNKTGKPGGPTDWTKIFRPTLAAGAADLGVCRELKEQYDTLIEAGEGDGQ